MLKMTSVLFEDDEMCLCIAQPTDPALILKVKLLFNLKDGVVENQHYDSWLATNNVEWAKKHDTYLQSRNLDD